jgi:hypothetical protein
LKTLKIFCRDYLGRPEVVKGFRFPSRPLSAPSAPSKRGLQRFYYGLKEPLAGTIFLFHCATGLRRSRTKRCWVTFYNEEVERALKECFSSEGYFRKLYKNSRKKRGEDDAPSPQRVVRLRDEKAGGFLTGTLTLLWSCRTWQLSVERNVLSCQAAMSAQA